MDSPVLTKSVLVNAPVQDVWNAWTTRDGIRRFIAQDARLEIRPLGKYEILFDPSESEGRKGSEGCTVLSFVPHRMLSFTWGAPTEFPKARREIAQWVVLFFNEAGPSSTLVTLQEFGWKQDEEGRKVYAYFDKAWELVLARLEHSFASGPIDWGHPWRPSENTRND